MQGHVAGLKGRIYRNIARAAGIAWLMLSAVLVLIADRETTAVFDTALRETAATILSFSSHELVELQSEGSLSVGPKIESAVAAGLLYQVWSADGKLAYRSATAPDSPLAPDVPGFGKTTLRGDKFRSFTAWNDDRTYQIRIAASASERKAYFIALSIGLSLALLLTFLVFMEVIRRQLNRSFSPLEATARLLASKSPSDLSAIETPRELPEIAPVIEAFNMLMIRIGRSIRRERRFADDAAHALRTPFSSLKILVTNVVRAPTESARSEALSMMAGVIDRSSGVVEQLLRLARIEQEPEGVDLSETIDLTRLAQSVVDEFATIAEERRVTIRRTGAGKGVWVRGNQAILSLALRSLVENAVSFVLSEGIVLVEVVHESATGLAMVRVHDDGPGVERDLQDRVLSLFFKTERGDSSNAGLGLPLVARIAQLHQGIAYVGVSTLLGGAMAVIRLPCPADQPERPPWGDCTTLSPAREPQ